MLISGFGTKQIEDLLFITFGSEYKNLKIDNKLFQAKYDLIIKYIQPTGFKVINWKQIKTTTNAETTLCSNKITDEIIKIENENMVECFDIDKCGDSFYQKYTESE